MEVLIVEDESRVVRFLESSLRAEGYTPRCCQSLEEAEAQLATDDFQPQAVILDRMLRGADGASLIPKLRARYPDCHILVLSAISLAEEKAAVLDLGADDYLSKPFSLSELSARLRAMSRRTVRAAPTTIIQIADTTLDLKTQLVGVNGKRLDLSKKEFQVLLHLMQNPGRVYNKYQLLDKIWDYQADIESNTVEVTIKNLRRKLQSSDSKLEIHNRRNVGYWVEP